jgi:general secretion pathway protein A
MYLEFYGLRESPFGPTPDPRFLFLTPGHREALAQLTYGVRERKGFIALTGEVGTGKTTLLRALMQRLEGGVAVAFVCNATLSFDEILEYMLEDFGIGKGEPSRIQRLFALNRFLIERQRVGQNAVLILDEAQNLDVATLEQVRLLSNFETTSEKLLQILLVGQPELRQKLQTPELRQLQQRIGLRCSVPHLDLDETRQYVRTRLRIAGAPDLRIFSSEAARSIATYTAGVPRLVNTLCDHCLVLGYAEQIRVIEPELVARAIESLEGRGSFPRPTRVLRRTEARGMVRWGIGAMVGVGIGTVGSLALGEDIVRLLTGIATRAAEVWQMMMRLVV